MSTHTYRTVVTWSGTTDSYEAYDRTHHAGVTAGKSLRLSADEAFLGDSALLNPEELVVSAASSCQLLSFLAVAARSGVTVVEYTDEATGEMSEDDPPMRLTQISLRPRIRVRGADTGKVERLVRKAHDQCYIANSLSTTVAVEPTIELVD